MMVYYPDAHMVKAVPGVKKSIQASQVSDRDSSLFWGKGTIPIGELEGSRTGNEVEGT